MKGIYNLNPPQSRYCQTWDVSVVLRYLQTLFPHETLSLKILTSKLAMLIALVLASRSHSLQLLSIDNMRKESSKYVLFYAGPLKQSRLGHTVPFVELKLYSQDERLCVYKVLGEYLNRTEFLRGAHKCLFVSYVKPHNPVTSSTISRWIRTIMAASGIDCNKYKPHSVRAASSSKAKLLKVPMQDILKVAGWSSARTFGQYYDKVVEDTTDSYCSAVLTIST